MTRDNIIQLAQHAGFGMPVQVFQFTIEELERFAALVVAAERERHMTGYKEADPIQAGGSNES